LGGSRKQRRHAEPLADLRSEAPLLVHTTPTTHAREQLGDGFELVSWQHDVVPRLRHGHPPGELAEFVVEHRANAGVDVLGGQVAAGPKRLRSRCRAVDQGRREWILRRKQLRITLRSLTQLSQPQRAELFGGWPSHLDHDQRAVPPDRRPVHATRREHSPELRDELVAHEREAIFVESFEVREQRNAHEQPALACDRAQLTAQRRNILREPLHVDLEGLDALRESC
jgi:hypothetical protein